MRRALFLLAALALGAAPRGAQATTAPPLTLTQQAKKADVIIRATLGTPSTVKDGEVTWLVYPLTVTETVAGDPASLPQLDGKPALYLLSGVEGLPDLRAGQDAFLLLYSKRLDSPIVGFAQGLYPVENGKVQRPGTDTAASADTSAAGSNAGTNAQAAPTTPPGSTTAPSATAPGDSTGAAIPTTPNTTPNPGPTPGTSPATTTPGSAIATPTPTTTPGPSTTPASLGAASPTLGTANPANPAPATSPATVSTPAPNDPNAIPSDPAQFRDALIAARRAK
ncbi:hypothetical protein Dgeo_1645 [Deinococcus geothermalis DSM 11300]|uniref:Uncharacterized protein n=1 Tax=Deinococcus geothermalis (strain DSM 11300 / CIP 105573 / AG-3a) TaxID=319795 RepID=Q1IXU4_DEIGD|nr:hypothetical protein [Deinococcus geothermalis]ABF45940.1 hypothetical protein Dgeo_1645 [Deinococcus geothermalis DSM 11300]